MSNDADYLLIHANPLLTMNPSGYAADKPLKGLSAADNGRIEDGAVAVKDGLVVECGTTEDLISRYTGVPVQDAENRLIMPGFVECHTHLVFGGTRENEMAMRLNGRTYLDILAAGGGIHSTVRATREASPDDLLKMGRERLKAVMNHGITTVEIKSGYGLSPEAELKILKVIKTLSDETPLDIVSTFLGAHVVPKDIPRSDYLAWLTQEAPDQVKGLADYFDVFCEDEAYTLEESCAILQSAKNAGYGLKIHAGQFNDLGGAGMAAGLGAASADHLDVVSDWQLTEMAEADTTAVLLPGAAWFLFNQNYPDWKRMEAAGVPLALSTDFNPGSCPTFSLQMIVTLACLEMKMPVETALTACTRNAAHAIGLGDRLGALAPGMQADMISLNISDPWQIPYHFGTNLVHKVWKKGHLLQT